MDYLIEYCQVNPIVTEELLAEIVSKILAVGQPLKILLFGSRARGDYGPDSDIDIFILEESDHEIRTRTDQYMRALRDVYPERTVIVRSVRQVEEWRNVPNCLETEAMVQGRVLYENSERMRDILSVTGGTRLVKEEEIEYKTPIDLARGYVLKADSDMFNAVHMLTETEGPYDTVCFHAEQAIEKYLKALLAVHGARVAKIHKLDELKKQCIDLLSTRGLEDFDLETISKYAVEARYGANFWPDREEAQQAVELAKEVIQILRHYLPAKAQSDS